MSLAGVQPTYAEHEPPAALRPFVQCLWTRNVAPGGEAAPGHRVLPDGCVDLIITLAGDWAPAHAASREERIDRALFVGAMTSPLVFQSAPGVAFVGVRCRPGAARALFGVPASELTNLRVPVDELWRGDQSLRPGGSDPIGALSRVLAERFRRASPAPRDVRAAVALLRRTRGRMRIGTLGTELGVTRQHLARRFAEHVGLSPKLLARIERMRHVIHLARGEARPSWSRIAYEAGYADQSHLVSEFGELVGATPGEWYDSISSSPGADRLPNLVATQ